MGFEAFMAMFTKVLGVVAAKGASSGDRAQAQRLRDMAVAQYGDAVAPQLDKMMAESVGKSNLYNEDPRLKDTEMQDLQQLSDTSGHGALDMQAKAGQLQAEFDAARANRGATQALDENMAARGMSGSGLEYLGNQMGIQNASNSLNQAGVENAAADEKRRMQQFMASGQLAGQMRGEGQEANRAQDAIDKFNTASLNNAQQYNLNRQETGFQNQMQVAGAKAGAYNQGAQNYDKNADQTENMVGSTFGAAGSTMDTVGANKKKPDDI